MEMIDCDINKALPPAGDSLYASGRQRSSSFMQAHTPSPSKAYLAMHLRTGLANISMHLLDWLSQSAIMPI